MTEPRPFANPWRVFAATSLGVVAVFVNISGLTVALPTITRETNASPGQASAIVLSYMLVTTALILVFGRLADIVGRRPLYLAGLAVFTAATALCAVAATPWLLIAARVLQGVGAAAFITNNTALLTDAFPPHELGRALGWNATVAALAQILGPILGGAATAVAGWRGLFLLCLPLAAAALLASVLVVPRRARPAVRERFDGIGALTSTLALAAAVAALSPGLPGSRVIYGVAAAVLFAGFLLAQTRRAHPLVDLRLLRDRAVGPVLIAVLLNAVATYAIVIVISLYGQGGGLDPVRAGALVVPVALGTVVAAASAGRLLNRFTPRALTATGMILVLVGLLGITVSLTEDATRLGSLPPWLALLGAGTGLFMTPSTSALMLAAPADRRGIANGLRSTVQNIGYLFGSALALGVATAGLDEQVRRAAFGGALDGVGPDQLAAFVDNLRVVGLLFAAVAALGIAACLCFPRGRPLSAITVSTEADRVPETVHR